MKSIRMSEKEYQAAIAAVKQPGRIAPLSGVREPKPSKYRARRTGGYASAKEAKRAQELKLLLDAGQIRNLREQVPFVLIPRQTNVLGKTIERPCRYIADFVYDEGVPVGDALMLSAVVEDCKGVRTPDYIIKRKLMLHVHGIRIRET